MLSHLKLTVLNRRTVGYDGRDPDSNPLTSPDTNQYEATVVKAQHSEQQQQLRIGVKLNPIKGVRLHMAVDIERLVMTTIERLGADGLGHEVTILDDDDCAFEDM
jgi:hypothetical protein|eukprot:COSAG03_NODE_1030_length_4991_cov_19.407604_2_plen_105_part_00